MKERLSETTRTLAVFLAAGFLIVSSVVVVSADRYCSEKTDVIAPFSSTWVSSSADAGAPCADLTCNGSDTCDCTTGRDRPVGQENFEGVKFFGLSYELSVDETLRLDDGTNAGECIRRPAKASLRSRTSRRSIS